jgi:hypothetical protein
LGVFDRIFGKRGEREARRAELRGELARAVELWMDAGRADEAARVMVLRGDAEPDPRARMQHYTQAAATAPPDHLMQRQARKKRALLTIALAGDAAVSAVARRDLTEAAHDLEAAGEQEKAAEAYALAGDREGEARALQKAGEVDRLEDLLSAEQTKDRAGRKRHEVHAELDLLTASGRRREALQAADAFTREQPDDTVARERAHALAARKAKGPIVVVELRGKRIDFVLGSEVVIGRSEGALVVPSHAISRRHVAIGREAGTAAGRDGGRVVVRDLGSRNGTQLRGMKLAGAVPVGDGIELTMGKEVPLRVAPSAGLAGAVVIEVGGRRYVAPLGATKLGVGQWRLEEGADGWLELVTDDAPAAFIDGVVLVPRTTLLVGDAIASARGAEAVLKVLG